MILSGGPRTVEEGDVGELFSSNLETLMEKRIKILGICFGHQLLAVHFGGRLEPGGNPEYGQTKIEIVDSSVLVNGLQENQQVWMSHSDEVAELPSGMKTLIRSGDNRIAAFSNSDESIFGVQFHPEVTHTPNGLTVLNAFLRDICRYTEKWKPENQIESIIQDVNNTVGESQSYISL